MDEIAWAAGFFDGEGHTVAGKAGRGNKYPQLCMSVVQVELEPILRWMLVVDGSRLFQEKAYLDHNPKYRAKVYGKNVLSTLNKLWPYLSEPKRVQARLAIEKWGKKDGS